MKLPMIRATFAARATIWIASAYAIVQGAGIVVGGPHRFAGPSFAVLREAPHPTLFWGWWLIVAGVLILTSSLGLQQVPSIPVQRLGLWVKGVALFGMAVWSFCFAKGALDAARSIETIPTTGGPTYVYIGLGVLVLVLIDERRSRRDVRR